VKLAALSVCRTPDSRGGPTLVVDIVRLPGSGEYAAQRRREVRHTPRKRRSSLAAVTGGCASIDEPGDATKQLEEPA